MQKFSGVSKEEVAMAMETLKPVESIESANYRDNKTDKVICLIDKISTGKDEEEILTNEMTIRKMINDLEKRDKEVIMLRFYKEKTQSEIAKILGITQVQVSRIERRVLNSMKLKLSS